MDEGIGGVKDRKVDSNEIRFFIIVPIYNVQLYLSRCIESVLNQTYKAFTLILINDGSTDNSYNIALNYKDERIILLNQENNGPSIARNKGLEYVQKIAYGGGQRGNEYILFLDSDDFLEFSALEVVAKTICKFNVDVVVYNNILSVDNNGNIGVFEYHPLPSFLENKLFKEKEIFAFLADEFITSTPLFVINANFLFKNNLSFMKGIIYEDVLFCTLAIFYAKSVYVDSTPIYKYFLSPDSIMRGKMNRNKRKIAIHSYYKIIIFYYDLYSTHLSNPILKKHFFNNALRFYKELLRQLQFSGYRDANFKKSDIAFFLPYLPFRYKFCFHFPRVYGLPKKLRISLKHFFESFKKF